MENALGVFEGVLDAARDISEDYYNDAELRRTIDNEPIIFDDFLAKMRSMMTTHSGIHQIANVDQALKTEVECKHDAGLIAAVDGTDAISLVGVGSKIVYAVGVIGITTQTLNAPRIKITRSHERLPAIQSDDDVLAVIDTLDRVARDTSWPRTFREWCERQEALRLIRDEHAQYVLVDGPLYTQNLLSQPPARRDLIPAMFAASGNLIGFIKEISGAPLLHHAGMALRPGEYWVVQQWRDVLAATRWKNEHEIRGWLLNQRSDWVRCLYRKGTRAFAFECHPDLVPIGLAIVDSSTMNSAVINHELPFLLERADRIIRTKMNADAKRENLISASPNYANLVNERTFR